MKREPILSRDSKCNGEAIPTFTMSHSPRPIPTEYGGIRFRSRLEARWYVFFQRLGIKALYEQEGFDLGRVGRYLPDFWLPAIQCFVEVKPVNPTDGERRKCEALADQTGFNVVLVIGEPGAWLDDGVGSSDIAIRFFPNTGSDYPYFFCRCKLCAFFGWEFEGRWLRLKCGCAPDIKAETTRNKEGRSDDDYNVAAAAEFANAYRFVA